MTISFTYHRMSEAQFRRIENDPVQASALFGFVPAAISPAMFARIEAQLAMQGAQGEAQLQKLKRQMADRTSLSIDKEWQVIHYLLTGERATKPRHVLTMPLHNVVMGGHAARLAGGDRPARVLVCLEVKDSSNALATFVIDALQSANRIPAMNALDLYGMPRPEGWTAKALALAFQMLRRLAGFFGEAAAAGEFVVICAS